MYILLSSYSLFSAYGHNGDLPSFPTRRSSDLMSRRRDPPVGRSHIGARRSGRSGRGARRRPAADAAGGGVQVRRLGPLVQDRKSTRLNSSHTVSSYAVFCLKKKKIDEKINLRN